MITNNPPTALSDPDLLAETTRAANSERQATAHLIALLAEVDRRRLYLGLGYPSLFSYCTRVLCLSEAAAYSRITAARAGRSFPGILTGLAGGVITLTTVSLLAGHLTPDNHETLLDAACHKSRREVEHLVASLVAQPAIATIIRRLPDRRVSEAASVSSLTPADIAAPKDAASFAPLPAPRSSRAPDPRTVVAPISAEGYLLKMTLSRAAHENLGRARALLRHQMPSGDAAAIVERALTVLVEQLEKSKLASTSRPRVQTSKMRPSSRHVPAAVRRAVWSRDAGQCAFVGGNGRCPEVGFLEFHHVVPFAAGGPTTAENLELRCRAHNAYEATLFEQSSAPELLRAR